MNWQFELPSFILLATAGIVVIVTSLIWTRRTTPSSTLLTWLMLAVVEWSLTSGLEAAAVNQKERGANNMVLLITKSFCILVIVLEHYTHRGSVVYAYD